jgi:MOSC domain-containing protein YiiM
MAATRVVSVHIGHIAPLGPDAVPSGFVKHPVAAAIQVTALGLVGDQQADLRVHGGSEKAVYGYSIIHYAAWRSEYPHHSGLLVSGGFGENLTMVKNGRAGWYYRVLQTGFIAAGDLVTLHDRPNPDFPFARLVALAARARATPAELARMAEMPGLASSWLASARAAIQSQ